MIREETRSVVIEKDLRHPPEKVWRALTETSLLDEWLMQNDFRPVVGHKFTFRAPKWNGIIECEVLTVERPRALAYTWSAMGVNLVTTWTLERTAEGTRLRMEQSGFGATQENAFQGAKYGWQNFLGGLERVLGGLPQ